MEKLPIIKWESIGDQPVQAHIQSLTDQLTYIEFTATLPGDIPQDIWQVNLQLDNCPDFYWAPHLAPEEGYCIDQHAFRCPAMIAVDAAKMIAVMPDLSVLKTAKNRWYMDVNALETRFSLGIAACEVPRHVLFRHKPGNIFLAGDFHFAFWVFISRDTEDLANPFRPVLNFYWKKEGEALFSAGQPAHGPLHRYCAHTYQWAFENWGKTVWQEFYDNTTIVGAPTFIVNYTQSPNYTKSSTWRECLSIWNQAWFSSLRSASGLYRYACATGNEEWKKRALQTKELALHMPQTSEGLFYSVVATAMQPRETVDGTVWESCGWETRFFGNSNRNPVTDDIARSPFHLLDMSITASYMLRWYRDLEKDARLLEYSERYAQALLHYQREDGFFPAWITTDGKVLEELQISPETSASITFLTELYTVTGNNRYLEAAQRAMRAVLTTIVPEGRWEDFETYWSCCRWGLEFLGKKIPRNGMYKQCNFSIFWTAEALYTLFTVTKEKCYLKQGQRVLDELLMTQAVWQPSYMNVPVFGGFGVMNCDGEWLDARQSLFAEIILQYGLALNNSEYIQRGIAALRASFVMMYCPENPQVKTEWEKRWPFFGREDYGFTMENYGHDGILDAQYTGIGEFTIYDWGNGAASEAYMRISQKYGALLLQYEEDKSAQVNKSDK